MPTTFDIDNAFNLLETATKNTFEADAWLGSTSNVALIEEKVRDPNDQDAWYLALNEIPAMGILCTGLASAEMDEELSDTYDLVFGLYIQVVSASEDFGAVDTEVKQILAQAVRLLHQENELNTDKLDGFLVGTDEIDIGQVSVEHLVEENESGQYIIIGEIEATVGRNYTTS